MHPTIGFIGLFVFNKCSHHRENCQTHLDGIFIGFNADSSDLGSMQRLSEVTVGIYSILGLNKNI